MELFQGYEGATFDEMFTQKGAIREHWKCLVDNLQKLQIKGLAREQEEIDWQLNENGVITSYSIHYTKLYESCESSYTT